MEKWFTPIDTASLPPASKVMAIAPHPDDEIFGCGGALHFFAKNAANVQVKIVTDGAGYAQEDERVAIFAIRRKESIEALNTLSEGIEAEFWGLQDRSLTQCSDLVMRIAAAIEEYEPDLILAPSPWEIHPDHIACSKAVWSAVLSAKSRSKQSIDLMFYEIGSPLRANFLLDITPAWNVKLSAMHCFASQMEQQDYARHITGLNTFRTYTLPSNVLQAEAYYFLSADEISVAALGSSADMAGNSDAAIFCMNRWVESIVGSATVHAEHLQKSLIEQWRHSHALQEQLKTLEAKVVQLEEHSQGERKVWALEKDAFFQQLEEQKRALEEKDRAIDELNVVISDTRESYLREINDIYQSTSWKLTKPLRKIRKLLK